MAFEALSIIFSASTDRLPSAHIALITKSMGLPPASYESRHMFMTSIGAHRRSAVLEIPDEYTDRSYILDVIKVDVIKGAWRK
jgi:hypothetical protein